MALDTSINRQHLINVFPDLARDVNFKILSECSFLYNCIAWAMGYSDRWVDPYPGPGHWWPDGVIRSITPEALISAFKAEGFELSDNCLPEEGYSKVVLYKKKTAEEWTHATRIVTNDIEYSKFGPAWDGQHSHDVLCNTAIGQEHQSYGIAYAYMKRRLDFQSINTVSGKMTIDPNNLAKLKAKLAK